MFVRRVQINPATSARPYQFPITTMFTADNTDRTCKNISVAAMGDKHQVTVPLEALVASNPSNTGGKNTSSHRQVI